MSISIVINLVVSKRLRDVANETNSPALEGDAAHLHADIFTSFGVLLGLIATVFTDAAWLDPAIALTLCAVIIWSGIRLMHHASKALVDESLPQEEHQRVERIVGSFSDRGVSGFHKIRSRKAGSQRLVDLHVQFTDTMTLREAHSLAHDIQHRIQAELHETDVLIHLEPE
jgi:cation diffusion facilitator family transporter